MAFDPEAKTFDPKATAFDPEAAAFGLFTIPHKTERSLYE
jgi:hypothetical protein